MFWAVGRLTMKRAMGAEMTAASAGTAHDTAANSAITVTLSTIDATERIFAYFGMARWVTQARIGGPNQRCSNSQLRKRGDEMENAQKAMRMKTVVGNNGTNTPTSPTATIIQPNPIAAYRKDGDLSTRCSLWGGISGLGGFWGRSVIVVRYWRGPVNMPLNC